jgi:hypothetical protein
VSQDDDFDPLFLTLYIGVRWFRADRPGRLDIDVFIDDEPVTVGQRFPTPKAKKKPDSYSEQLAPGDHVLRATCRSLKAEFRQEFEMIGKHLYAQLTFNHYPKADPRTAQVRPFDPATAPEHREGFEWEIRNRDFGWR